MVNYYHRFIPRAARVMYDLLKGKPAANAVVDWTAEAKAAFPSTKAALASATMLVQPRMGAELALTVDASDMAVGDALEQCGDQGKWEQLAFFSRKLDATQARYSTFDRELMAAHSAIRQLRYYLEGRKFAIFTDHKPLTFALSKVADARSGRQQRQLAAIVECTVDLRHVAGKDNVLADALLRAAVSAVKVGVDFLKLAVAQQADQDKLLACQTAIIGLKLREIPLLGEVLQGQPSTILCDVLLARPRSILPPGPFRRRVFDVMHGLSHRGVKAMQTLVGARYVWQGLRWDVAQWTKKCLPCQRSNVTTHIKAPLKEYTPPSGRFAHVNIDLVGPMALSNGFMYVLTAVDRFTRWPIAIPIPDKAATTVARAFWSGWVANFGMPTDVLSDRGKEFTNQLWRDLSNLLGSTSYHPQANGAVERFHRP
jgi:hypothetical protein